jgi:UDP-N-acetylglucosamine 1-carboxyvinyltransferase
LEHFLIEGGKPLCGTVRIQGAKNAALPILAATVLEDGVHELYDVPRLSDIDVMGCILEALGAKITRFGNRVVVDTTTLRTSHIPDTLMRRMRSSIFLMGPLLSRFQEVSVTRPGGCAIGARPIDLHLKGLQMLGAQIEETGDLIRCTAKRLVGTTIRLDLPSVGATENVMMAAVLADGITVIENAAREPEIVDLQRYLNQMGADIEGAGTNTIIIRGVKRLRPVPYEIIPDRIVTGTLVAAAVATSGEVTLTHTIPEHLHCMLLLLRQAGAEIKTDGDTLWVRGSRELKAVGEIQTEPYPGFPTDLQPQMMSLLTLAEGTSVIKERIFDARLKHVDELRKMGAVLQAAENSVRIRGVRALSGTQVKATDLRAGAALVIAGLAAHGTTSVYGVEHIERGYDRLDQMFQRLGGRIQRVPDQIPSMESGTL